MIFKEEREGEFGFQLFQSLIKTFEWQLGGKGANLAEMASIGLSVPPGLTISTEACQEYQSNGCKLPDGLWEEILEGLQCVEKDMGAFLGDPSKPLLLSVRSGAAVGSSIYLFVYLLLRLICSGNCIVTLLRCGLYIIY